MAPAIISRILSRATPSADIRTLGPLAARSILFARNDSPEQPHRDPASGALHPEEINNNAVFAVFGLLGAAFVVVGIWFFFWAKNGGFYFKESDWDDYKSTVLRRPKIGPNGTVYSDVTASTNLGGGSVYKDVDDRTAVTRDDDLTTVVSATTGITGITGGVSDFSGREKRRQKREQKEREKERRREEKRAEKEARKRNRRKVGADGQLIDEEAEKEAEEQLRSYRHEKAARVGGLNREADGSEWDGSTNPSWSTVSPSHHHHADSTVDGTDVTSELMGDHHRTPTKKEEREREKPSGARGIRKVYSTADKNAVREAERIKAEARKLREKGREREARKPKRDFSFTSGAEETVALRRIDEVAGEGSLVSAATSSYVSTENTYSEYTTPTYALPPAPAPVTTKRQSTHRDTRDRDRARSKSRTRYAAQEPASDARSSAPGAWAESDIGSSVLSGTESDVGTKVYRHSHHIPVASTVGSSELSYAEEKRKRRGGAGARKTEGRS